MNDADFDRIGQALADEIDGGDARSSSPALRARIVERATARRSRAIVPATAGLALAAAVLALVLVLMRHRAEPALTFGMGDAVAGGQVGAYIAPAVEQPLGLRFSDGSRVQLAHDARARVGSTTPRGASLLLEAGRAEVDVRHRDGADWSVSAGPYVVHVTGTSFSVAWDPASAALEVVMRTGAVVVRGPGVESGAIVQAGQRFTSRASSVIEPAASAAPAEPMAPQPSGVAAASPSAEPAVAPDRPERGAGLPERWSALVAKGQYARVLEAAELRGVDATLASAGPDDVGALADAARFGGRGELARRAFLALRSRFPGSARATSAAFLLGRMSDDGGGSRAAIGWYDRYLAEAPGGALAPEALGRKMVALRRAGDTQSARAAADDYLRRFPRGPYAGVARDMTSP